MKPKKSLTKMSTGELAEATAEFDREFVADSFRPPDAAARKRWQRAKHKPGRPPVGKGVKVISLSVEKGLLAKADRLAKKLRISRAALISQGLQKILAEQGSK